MEMYSKNPQFPIRAEWLEDLQICPVSHWVNIAKRCKSNYELGVDYILSPTKEEIWVTTKFAIGFVKSLPECFSPERAEKLKSKALRALSES